MKKRIYYHDTDCGGVVYYGNYLKFLEEARSEYLEDMGFSVKSLMDQGILFVVRRQEIEYKHPAVYGDTLEIKTLVKEHSHVRIQFAYEILNQDGKLLSKPSRIWSAWTRSLNCRKCRRSCRKSLSQSRSAVSGAKKARCVL